MRSYENPQKTSENRLKPRSFYIPDGSAKKYTQWLQEDTGFDCMETKSANVKSLQEYDTIILGGGVFL